MTEEGESKGFDLDKRKLRRRTIVTYLSIKMVNIRQGNKPRKLKHTRLNGCRLA